MQETHDLLTPEWPVRVTPLQERQAGGNSMKHHHVDPKIAKKTYEEHLKELSLEKRRMWRGGINWIIKNILGPWKLENLNINNDLIIDNSNITRNNGYEITDKMF